MRQLRTSSLRNARFARILVLVALLCAAAIPVVEAAHLHGIGEGNADCMLCKSPSLAPVVAAVPLVFLALNRAIAPPRLTLAALAQRYLPRQSRGPPRYT
ncbi:hypothetical protein FV139_10125 [Parahaliea maris]|uniref:Uncharacterized protein n=1 Tax=Parahaliea maris TaxID=2716870 RepID=A0A5C9A2H6_9GAMM|nr:hypothetical protein [Parahaliea maris]TXS93970.1 hypothetical protein FV139_10125 [Parahaliea maris]